MQATVKVVESITNTQVTLTKYRAGLAAQHEEPEAQSGFGPVHHKHRK